MQATERPVRVYLAEDSLPIRERIAGLLAAEHMQVVGGAATPRECIAGILHELPDVVVLDVQLDGGTGQEVLRAVRQTVPGIAFVVFTNNTQPPYVRRYLGEGAASFLDKSRDFEKLPQAIAAAARPTTDAH